MKNRHNCYIEYNDHSLPQITIVLGIPCFLYFWTAQQYIQIVVNLYSVKNFIHQTHTCAHFTFKMAALSSLAPQRESRESSQSRNTSNINNCHFRAFLKEFFFVTGSTNVVVHDQKRLEDLFQQNDSIGIECVR